MNRPLIAAVALAAASALVAGSGAAAAAATGSAASAPARSAKKPAARKPAAPELDSESPPDDNLNPVQLTLADRVLTGVADCEFKQKVAVEKLEGHGGNFKVTYEKRAWIVQPRETTTGAIVLVDKGGNIEWLQIPKKSMLMNVKLHQRMVDDCQEDEQRIASQSSAQAAANAPVLAPSVATPASVAAAARAAASSPATPLAAAPASSPAPAMQTTTTTVTTTTVKLMPTAPVQRGAEPPDAAASGMWK